MGALALAAGIVPLALFAFVVHHLASKLGIANWSSLGVAALFVAVIGGFWLIGNSFLDIIAARGSRRYPNNPNQSRCIQINLPWLVMAPVIGSFFVLFAE